MRISGVTHLILDFVCVVQEVGRRLPISVASVHPRLRHVGFLVDKVSLRQVLPKFPLPILIHQFLHITYYHHIIDAIYSLDTERR
jgi:hypothetical protein